MSDYPIDQTGEPWVPEAPDDERPIAEAVECYCGTIWYINVENSCPSCGREEDEAGLPDEELEE